MTFGIIVKGGTPKFHCTRKEVKSFFVPGDVRHEIAKDPVMYRTIKEGNASDKKLNKDVLAIESHNHEEHKRRVREPQLKKIAQLKERYRKKYGVEPI